MSFKFSIILLKLITSQVIMCFFLNIMSLKNIWKWVNCSINYKNRIVTLEVIIKVELFTM